MKFPILVSIWLLIKGLLFCSSAEAQTRPTGNENGISDTTVKSLSMATRRWTADEGLPSDRIDGIAQTSDGHIWICGNGDIARLNDREFETIDLDEKIGRYVSSADYLRCDSRGVLWLFTRNNLIITYEKGKFSLYHPESSHAFGLIRAATEDQHGNTIAFSKNATGSHVYRLGRESWSLLADLPPEIAELTSAQTDEDGDYWMRDVTNKIIELPGTDPRKPSHVSQFNTASQIIKGQDSRIMVATRDGIHRLRQGPPTLLRAFHSPFPQGSILDAFAIDHEGSAWIREVSKGLHHCSPDGILQRVDLAQSGFSPPAYRLFVDAENTLWICTFSGLIQISYSPFVTWNLPKGDSSYRFLSVREDGQGLLWFHCQGAIGYLDPNKKDIKLLSTFPVSNRYLIRGRPSGGAFAIDRQGRLSMCTPEGITPMDTQVFSSLEGTPHLTDSLVTPDGNLWVTTYDGLFLLRNETPKKYLEQIPIPGSVGNVSIETLVQDTDGSLIIATKYHGLYRFHPASEMWDCLIPPGEQKLASLRSFHRDEKGNLWGLSKKRKVFLLIQNQNVTEISYAELGLSIEDPIGIHTDSIGGFWFSTTAHGVARVDSGQLLKKMQNPENPLRFTWFDRKAGLGTRAGSYLREGIHRAVDGKIWIANGAGVSAIDPTLWQRKISVASPFPLLIDSVELDEQQLELFADHSKSLTIDPTVRKIAIHYTSLNHRFLGDPQFRYRMKNYDSDWTTALNRTTAYYENLPPGNYLFEVAAQDPDGEWNPIPSTLALEIIPAWWQKTSVRILITGAVALVCFLLYRARINTLKDRSEQQRQFAKQLISTQEQERRRIAHELHDSLGQEMLVLKGQMEMAAVKTPQARDQLLAFSDDVLDTIRHTRRISHDLCPPDLEHLGLSAALESLAHDLRHSFPTEVHTQIAQFDPRLPTNQEIGLFRIAQESVSNIIKHAKPTAVSLSLTEFPQEVTLQIEDDGCGFSFKERKEQARGLGLNGMSERAHVLGAILNCESSPGQGTLISVVLKKDSPKPL